MKPDSCLGCGCERHGQDFSAIEGTGANGVLSVAEGSGENEQRDQLPLRPYAAAGGVEERTLRRMGLSRQSFSVTNCVRCRPRNNWLEGAPWEYDALSHCRPNLAAAIAERRPRVVRALGNIPIRTLTGVAGEKLGVSYLAGYVLPLAPDLEWIAGTASTPVIASFHPSFLRHGKMAYQGQYARVLQRAMNIAAGKDLEWMWGVVPEEKETHGSLRYSVCPSLDEARSFAQRVRDNVGLAVSYDIETGESTSLDEDAREGFTDTAIRLVQFSVDGGAGIAFPWEGQYREVAGDVLRSPNLKCGHNVWLFDNKVLRAAGEREGIDLAPRGVIHDTLQMFHHWQPDLPAHLQFAASFVNFPFPWKHLAATDIAFYGCCDADATLRLYTMLEATLRKERLWDGYVSQVYEVRPILAEMEDRGMPIDDDARVALGAEFEKAQAALRKEIVASAGGLGRVHPKQGYKGTPPEVKAWLAEHPTSDVSSIFGFDDDGETYCYELRDFAVQEVDAASGEPVTRRGTTRWCRVYDFNPNSREQVIAYMRAKGHPVPKDIHREDADGENPETTNEKELRRLANKTGDVFYLKVIEYRGFTKLRGTYIDGFVPAADGCVHTTFTFDTAIAQLSSRNPNVQNFTKLKPTPALAKAMRGMVRAKPGKVLTEWDLKSCHALTLGFLAEDATWIRLARLDIHSFTAGLFLNLWTQDVLRETDDQLLARFKALKTNPEHKRVRDDQAKHGILGIGNGLQERGLYERYMEQFPARPCPACSGTGTERGVRGWRKCGWCQGTRLQSGLAIAGQILAVARQIGPKVFAWQRRMQQSAHEDQRLVSPFGHQRRFYEVFRWDAKKQAWGHGDQAEEAIAYMLSNVAHAHMREIMKAISRAGFAERYGLFNQIHDALLFHFDAALLAEHVRDIYPLMTASSTVLRNPTAPDGLWIDVEAKAGERWSDMREIVLPTRREEARDAALTGA